MAEEFDKCLKYMRNDVYIWEFILSVWETEQNMWEMT